MKVGLVLKKNEVLAKTMKRPIRVIPFIVEDEKLIYQRNQIIKSYETFQNEKKINYF